MSSLTVIILVIFMTGCSFNKMVLHPTKFPKAAKAIAWIDSDTISLQFSGSNHQPVAFLKNWKDTTTMDFTIESVLFQNARGDTLNGWFLKPKNQVPEITILHLHGNAGSIPFDLGTKLFDNANEPKTFFEITRKCHLCGPVYYPDDISRKIKAMLEK